MDTSNLKRINQFQSKILQVAKQFVGLNLYNFHTLINNSLQIIGEELQADRAYIFSYNFVENTMNNDYEWVKEGVTPEIDNLQNIPISDFLDGWVNEHRKNRNVIIDNLENIDHESSLYHILSMQGIVSLITLPIFIEKECYGFIGYDANNDTHLWKQYEDLLNLLPDLYSSLISNYEMLEEVRILQIETEKAANMQKDFLAKMTHEIRTPINGVANAMYLLDESELTFEQEQYIEIMKYSIDALSGMVNNVLDYSKKDASKLIHKSSIVNLESECIKLINVNKYMANSKDIGLYLHYDYTLPSHLNTDIEKLRQILNNLIQNAIKYTNYGHVEVKVTTLEDIHPYVKIKFEVIDTGIGIKQENLDKIFEEFYQVGDSLNKNPSGTGLGLTIAKSFVEFLKGDMHVESIEKEGSNFSFTLTMYSPTEEKRQLLNKEILFIDLSNGSHSNIKHQLNAHFSNIDECTLFNIKTYIYNEYDAIFVYTNDSSTFKTKFSRIEKFFVKEYDNTKKVLLYDTLKSQDIVDATVHFDCSSEVPTLSEKLIDSMESCGGLYQNSDTNREDVSMTKKNKVLLVDDNNINRKVMAALLKGMYLEVEEAKDGYEAIEKVKEHDFKMILMDIFMPGLDGYETTKRIRELDGVRGTVPIIAVTANDIESTKEKVIENGMNGVLSKPLKKGELENLLNEYFTQVTEQHSQSNEDLPIFNQDAFEHQFEEPFLRKEIVKTFLEENETDLENIKLAFMSANCDQIHKIVHYLKGTFSYLRAERVLKLAQTIIDFSKKDMINEILYLEQSLIHNYQLLSQRLQKYMETIQ